MSDIDDKNVFDPEPEPEPMEKLTNEHPDLANYLKAAGSAFKEAFKPLQPHPMPALMPQGRSISGMAGFEPAGMPVMNFSVEQYEIGNQADIHNMDIKLNTGWRIYRVESFSGWLVVIFMREQIEESEQKPG